MHLATVLDIYIMLYYINNGVSRQWKCSDQAGTHRIPIVCNPSHHGNPNQGRQMNKPHHRMNILNN